MPVSRPEPLADSHELNNLFSGVTLLDEWLKRRARANQVSGASRTLFPLSFAKWSAISRLFQEALPRPAQSAVFEATCLIQFRLRCSVVLQLIGRSKVGA